LIFYEKITHSSKRKIEKDECDSDFQEDKKEKNMTWKKRN
jgi:hypothetical protein